MWLMLLFCLTQFFMSVSGECGSLEAPQGEDVSLYPGFSCPLGVIGMCCLILTPFH
jgi:hypothetical protein